MKRYLKTLLGGHLFIALAILSILILAGTVGYISLQGLSPFEALYHTVVTISTVGFQDLPDATTETRLLTMGLILAGVITLYYLAGAIVEAIISGRLFEVFKLGAIETNLGKMRNHVILCGYGDVGALIAEKVKDVVVIEREDSKYGELVKKNFLAVKGDSTHSETLRTAGVERAASMVIALDSDPEVVYTILTAKEMNPDLKVYARANEVTSVKKMKKAGANYVICLPEVGSRDLLNALKGSTETLL